MDPQARSQIVEIFCRDNNLISASIPDRIKHVIADVVAPYYLFVECLDPSGLSASPNPIDGLLITLTKRMHDVATGALSLLSLHKLQQAEILSRPIMESALSLLYISKENSGERLVQYFTSYIREEREQNRKWQNELRTVPESWKAKHEARIRDKATSLNGYEDFVEQFASEIGATYPCQNSWPNFFGVCAGLKKAIDYRTVYMAMCSQSHCDAEDILNLFMVGSIQGCDGLLAKLERETGNFSIYLVLCSLLYYLECLTYLGRRYGFATVVHQSLKSHAVLTSLAEDVSSDEFIGNSLDGWVT